MGQRDARGADPATEVEHPRRAARGEPLVELRHRGQPGRGEVVDEHRPVEAGDPVADTAAVGRVGDPPAGAEGFREEVDDACDAGQHQRCAPDEPRAIGLEQCLGDVRLEGEPAVRSGCRAVCAEETRDRLLLQPLGRVSLGDAGVDGQLRGREGTVVAEHCVQAELLTDVDREQFQGAVEALEQSFSQSFLGVGGGRGGQCGHDLSSAVGDATVGRAAHTRLTRGERLAVEPGGARSSGGRARRAAHVALERGAGHGGGAGLPLRRGPVQVRLQDLRRSGAG